MSNKFIWQKKDDSLDYLLVSDETLNSYSGDQDLGILARIIKRKRTFVVFLHKNDIPFFFAMSGTSRLHSDKVVRHGESPWGYVDFDEGDDIYGSERSEDMKILTFDSLYKAREYVENYWDRLISESPLLESLEDQYSDQRLSLFHDYVENSHMSDDQLVNVFLNDLEQGEDTAEIMWNEYETSISRLKKQYENYRKALEIGK